MTRTNLQLARRRVVSVCLAAGALVPFVFLAPAARAGDTAAPSPSGGKATTYNVEIRNFAFEPKEITVPAGARIVWVNRDEEPHLVVSVGGAFKPSQALDTNDSFATVLAKPGTYQYYCGIHPMMVGRIVVR
ncbi:plastocyanin [Trinickia symbiotica]|uniref:EfeO-type cupredoxin-like domain-containing protein n=1 Tax=Trinickia symbiotica TaxID=863227 RepID=A0A2N7X199_9BURK|nr:cupredoxin family copper-binding protein [Trinickia symbiotica]PMS35352.1 hypothetical protein C0Z20_17780 [Trinickia symbiotica]PPK45362.1 plastocyanin [Trinickia symbiotica]